jgi:heme-degrading monooxygenase HmoA
MVSEIVKLKIKEGHSVAFEEAFKKAKTIVARSTGFVSLKLYKKIELSDVYLMKIAWHSIEDHKFGFRLSPEYLEWKALLHRFYDPMPTVEYFEEIMGQPPIE